MKRMGVNLPLQLPMQGSRKQLQVVNLRMVGPLVSQFQHVVHIPGTRKMATTPMRKAHGKPNVVPQDPCWQVPCHGVLLQELLQKETLRGVVACQGPDLSRKAQHQTSPLNPTAPRVRIHDCRDASVSQHSTRVTRALRCHLRPSHCWRSMCPGPSRTPAQRCRKLAQSCSVLGKRSNGHKTHWNLWEAVFGRYWCVPNCSWHSPASDLNPWYEDEVTAIPVPLQFVETHFVTGAKCQRCPRGELGQRPLHGNLTATAPQTLLSQSNETNDLKVFLWVSWFRTCWYSKNVTEQQCTEATYQHLQFLLGTPNIAPTAYGKSGHPQVPSFYPTSLSWPVVPIKNHTQAM